MSGSARGMGAPDGFDAMRGTNGARELSTFVAKRSCGRPLGLPPQHPHAGALVKHALTHPERTRTHCRRTHAHAHARHTRTAARTHRARTHARARTHTHARHTSTNMHSRMPVHMQPRTAAARRAWPQTAPEPPLRCRALSPGGHHSCVRGRTQRHNGDAVAVPRSHAGTPTRRAPPPLEYRVDRVHRDHRGRLVLRAEAQHARWPTRCAASQNPPSPSPLRQPTKRDRRRRRAPPQLPRPRAPSPRARPAHDTPFPAARVHARARHTHRDVHAGARRGGHDRARLRGLRARARARAVHRRASACLGSIRAAGQRDAQPNGHNNDMHARRAASAGAALAPSAAPQPRLGGRRPHRWP